MQCVYFERIVHGVIKSCNIFLGKEGSVNVKDSLQCKTATTANAGSAAHNFWAQTVVIFCVGLRFDASAALPSVAHVFVLKFVSRGW